jgi:hypothetical protein
MGWTHHGCIYPPSGHRNILEFIAPVTPDRVKATSDPDSIVGFVQNAIAVPAEIDMIGAKCLPRTKYRPSNGQTHSVNRTRPHMARVWTSLYSV